MDAAGDGSVMGCPRGDDGRPVATSRCGEPRMELRASWLYCSTRSGTIPGWVRMDDDWWSTLAFGCVVDGLAVCRVF